MSDDQRRGRLLRTAEFDPAVKSYWLLSGSVVLLATIVGIPVIPIFLIIGYLLTGKYLDAMECELTTRALRVKKGLINQTERSVPLDKITDLALYRGPIMRAMGIDGLRVETAGQSNAQGGALVSLIGVKDARAFRDEVLTQRDRVTEFRADDGEAAPPSSAPARARDDDVLGEIRDAVLRIESRLAQPTERQP